jgi:glutaredoxin
MKQTRYLPVVLLLVLFFGALPVAVQYLYEPAAVEEQGVQVNIPVIMYSTRWCPYCRKARAYFEGHKIAYVEYDVEASAENRQQFEALKGRGVPLILVGDKRMEGFSARSFEALLK